MNAFSRGYVSLSQSFEKLTSTSTFHPKVCSQLCSSLIASTTLTLSSFNWLDLTREHVYLSRALLPHAVKHLGLFNLPKCKLSQLVHFLNPFHSLTSFELGFDANDADCLEYSGQLLPPPCTAYSRTLTSLELELIPGVGKFLDWCLKAETFLSYLEELILLCRNKDDSKFRASLEGVGLLLSRCSRSVGELTLKLWYVPMVNEISDICKSRNRFFVPVICSYYD